MANRFVDTKKELKTIDLGDGDWVKVLGAINYGIVSGTAEKGGPNGTASLHLLSKVIKEWNLKDANGRPMPITLENIEKLDSATGMAIMKVVEPMIEVDPKASAG